MNLKLDWCSHEAAKYAVEHWHYSRCMPSGKLVKIGVWENGKFIGAIIYGLGATPNLCKPYGLKINQVAELVRVAISQHKTPISKMMAYSLKMIKKICPGLRIVVSFADTAEGHHGGIYQATNWIYTGAALLDSWIINGTKMHPRSVVAKFGSRSLDTVKRIDPNAKKKWGRKHRYLMPLDNEMYQRVISMRKPYPKRAGSRDNAAVDFQSAEGGAIPTPALQNQQVSNDNRT